MSHPGVGDIWLLASVGLQYIVTDVVIRHLNGILFSKCFFMQSSVSASDNEGME